MVKSCEYCGALTDSPCETDATSSCCMETTVIARTIVKKESTYTLYIIPRQFYSMTAGKAMAHCAHAANAFVHEMNAAVVNVFSQKMNATHFDVLNKEYSLWGSSTLQGFGTTIVLKGAVDDAKAFVTWAQSGTRAWGNLVTDPTYPYQLSDEFFHLLPKEIHSDTPIYNERTKMWNCFRRETTAFYVFCDKQDAASYLKSFKLHP